jgi:hypothetical protein
MILNYIHHLSYPTPHEPPPPLQITVLQKVLKRPIIIFSWMKHCRIHKYDIARENEFSPTTTLVSLSYLQWRNGRGMCACLFSVFQASLIASGTIQQSMEQWSAIFLLMEQSQETAVSHTAPSHRGKRTTNELDSGGTMELGTRRPGHCPDFPFAQAKGSSTQGPMVKSTTSTGKKTASTGRQLSYVVVGMA